MFIDFFQIIKIWIYFTVSVFLFSDDVNLKEIRQSWTNQIEFSNKTIYQLQKELENCNKNMTSYYNNCTEWCN